jgi:hypothetical protein
MRSNVSSSGGARTTVSCGAILHINLEGLKVVLDLLVNLFDPISRKEREEKIRHNKVMNQYEEEFRNSELFREWLKNIQEMREIEGKFRSSVGYDLSGAEVDALLKLCIREIEQQSISLEKRISITSLPKQQLESD